MTAFVWARMPVNWVRLGGLCDFQPHDCAASVAALQIYLLFCLQANRARAVLTPELGCVRMPYDDIQAYTGLARATVSKGLRKLEALSLIERQGSLKKTVFRICDFEASTGWAKVPARLCTDIPAKLTEFSARSRLHLNALKLYVLILVFRNGSSPYASIGYDRIHDYTGINKSNIRKAISYLIELNLIVVDRFIRDAENHQAPNAYFIVGLGMPPLSLQDVDPSILRA